LPCSASAGWAPFGAAADADPLREDFFTSPSKTVPAGLYHAHAAENVDGLLEMR
jgi:hypothetical protein